jgi:hypothetical protein
MMNLRKPLIAALSGVFLASALSWAAPVAPVRAAPGDVNVGLAMVIEGQGNGHGRGLSQYGAVGWATVYGKDWTWILDHYYGGTSMGAVPAGLAGLTVISHRWSRAKLRHRVGNTPIGCGARLALLCARRRAMHLQTGSASEL